MSPVRRLPWSPATTLVERSRHAVTSGFALCVQCAKPLNRAPRDAAYHAWVQNSVLSTQNFGELGAALLRRGVRLVPKITGCSNLYPLNASQSVS